jgi:hypothetical protein
MSSKMVKELRKLFKETTGENVHLWCESLSAIMRYDSPECSETLAEDGVLEIENQAEAARDALVPVELEAPAVVVGTLKQSVDELVLAKQELALEALQTTASMAEEEQKIDTLSKTNDTANPSIITAINQRYAPQPAAIPMLFAVFSRKNDGYGQG